MLWIRPTVASTAPFSRQQQHPQDLDTMLHSWVGVGTRSQKTRAEKEVLTRKTSLAVVKLILTLTKAKNTEEPEHF